MSTKPMKPIGKQKQQTLDLSKADTMKCDDCGNYLFINSYIIKRISAIMSPNGQEGLVPVQVYSCGNCGKVPKTLLDGSGIENSV